MTTSPPPRRKTGLGWIVAGIVAGVALGLLSGRNMWLATGGAAQQYEQFSRTEKQKIEFADREARKASGIREQLKTKTDLSPDDRAGLEKQAREIAVEAQRLRAHAGKNRAAREDHVRAFLSDQEQAALPKDPGEREKAALALLKHVEQQPRLSLWRWVYDIADFLGDIFLQMLKLLVIPLVLTSMICGVSALGDVRSMGRIGRRTVFYYLTTTGVAVIIGLVLVNVVQPGVNADDTFAFVEKRVLAKEGKTIANTIFDVFRGDGSPGDGMFPKNLFEAAATTNVLALIVFALVFGGVLTTLGKAGRPVIDFFHGANEAVMKMVGLVMKLAPVGIFGLVAAKIASQGGAERFGEELGRLGAYAGTVIGGLLLHAVIVLPFLLRRFSGRSPLSYFNSLRAALLTAFSTASSSATLPVTMECVEDQAGVSNRSASFVLPLGATVNMDGTAMYEAVAVLFIAQSTGTPLGMAAMIVVFLTATLAAIGAAGIPEAGLVTMVIVLTAVGLPTDGIGMILVIDWFLDRCRTTVNVWGDAVGAAVIDAHQEETPDRPNGAEAAANP